jgi:hypothetical protein
MSDSPVVHVSVAPLGDWYYYTHCGTYASSDWTTNKLIEATCGPCLHGVVIGDAVE